jgi:hypothetical protein
MDSLRHMPPSPALSDLSRPELEALLVELFGKVRELEKAVAELRKENARLKGLKGRPDIKPGKPSCQSALNSFQATASKSFQLVRPVSAAFCAA